MTTLEKAKKFMPPSLLNILRDLRQACYRFADVFKPRLNIIKYCGFKVCYYKGPGINYRIRFGNPDRIYERQLCEAIAADLSAREQPLFIDVGANIGLISLYVLSRVPKVKVYAFEPGPNQSELLAKTIALNKLETRLELYKYGLNNRAGRTNFFTSRVSDSSGDGLMDTGRGDSKKIQRVEVEVVPMDEWWKKHGSPKITTIKIDTEGAELWVLRGAIEVIQTCRPTIFLEISRLNLKVYPYTSADIVSWLNGRGYSLFTLEGQPAGKENIVALVATEDTFMAKPV